MIREEFVTRDTAKLLRTCGYPGIDMALTPLNAVAKANEDASLFNDKVWREAGLPTQTQAMRWLREDKNLFVEISYDPGFARPPYYAEIQTLPEGGFIDDTSYPMAHRSYEFAAEAAIQAACKYLIKNKQQ